MLPNIINNKDIIELPLSKSYIIRLAIAAFFSNDIDILESIAQQRNLSDDIKAILRCIYSCIIGNIAFCGESATILRLFTLVYSFFLENNVASFIIEGTLQSRLIKELHELLLQVNIKNTVKKVTLNNIDIIKNVNLGCSSYKYSNCLKQKLPTDNFNKLNYLHNLYHDYVYELNSNKHNNKEVTQIDLYSSIKSGDYIIDASKTSQFLSGLLMSLPLCRGNSKLEVINLHSKGYVELTLDIIKKFGIRLKKDNLISDGISKDIYYIPGNQKYTKKINDTDILEKDWSAAANLLVLGAIHGNIKLRGLSLKSLQPDKIIYDFFKNININMNYCNNILTINKSHINGFIFDASNNPDLIPPLVVLALYAESESYIYGIDRLIKKECDRKTAIIEEFQKLGAKIICEENKNRFVVFPSILKSNYVSSHQDHRMAMALAIAAVNIKDGIEIDNIKCVNKSYPNFFDIFKQ